VLVLASIEPESYGLVLVEALAAGARVVATDLGGPREIVSRVTAGTGRLVAPGDAAALAAAVIDLLPPATSTGARRTRPATLVTVPADFAGLFEEVAGRGRAGRR
jgi:phosphatidylinositol alpha-mannosyltransferase